MLNSEWQQKVKGFNVNDALWSVANAWSNVNGENLKKKEKTAWHNLLPDLRQ